MFEISEGMRLILITRAGVNSFNDALAEADIPYRLFRVPAGYNPPSDDDVHLVSVEQVRLPASTEPFGVIDLETVDPTLAGQFKADHVHTREESDGSTSGYNPTTGLYERDCILSRTDPDFE